MPLRYWLCSGLSLGANAVGLRRSPLLVRDIGCGDSSDQGGRIDVQPASDLNDVVETQVAGATLDLADESPVHIGELREGLLADAKTQPLGSDPLPKDTGSIGFCFTHGS